MFGSIHTTANCKMFLFSTNRSNHSDDVIKKIFVFAPNCARATNKNMSELGAESELIEMKKLYKPYQENQDEETWVVHPKRTHLNPIEKEFGFRGIVNSIEGAIESCKTEGRISIHSGTYETERIIVIYRPDNFFLILCGRAQFSFIESSKTNNDRTKPIKTERDQ